MQHPKAKNYTSYSVSYKKYYYTDKYTMHKFKFYRVLTLALNIFVLSSHSLYAVVYDAVISLGGDCQVTYQLRRLNLRPHALPFDWLITPFDSLRSLLEQHFDQFLDKCNLTLVTTPDKYILDNRYGVRLIHDFKLNEQFLENYSTIHDRYTRRTERFYELIFASHKVLFIRKNITKEQAQVLSELIHKLFPHLDYTLLALATTQEIKQPWGIAHVQNYYLSQPEPYSWKGDDAAWSIVLNTVELNNTQAQTTD
jgi:hypothetical protein